MRSEWRAWSMAVAITLAIAGCDRGVQQRTTEESSAAAAERYVKTAMQRDQRDRQAAWLQLGDPQRQRIRDAAAAFATLPADEQARLRAEFAQVDRAEQRGWRLGPDIGALWPQLSPLFSYVAEDERAPLLRILHEMSADELQALARIAWRTPPEQRDALRRELIAVPPANLPAWLATASER